MSLAAEIRDTVSMFDALELLDIPFQPGDTVFIYSWTREENTPSVHVDERLWYDFGSGIGGDVFAFVQSYVGCSFGQALAILSRSSGVNMSAGRVVPAASRAPPAPDLMDRVQRESRPLDQERDGWLLAKLAERHGVTFGMAQRWGLRVGPGDALWIPHWPDGDQEAGPVTMVKVRDYRSDRRVNLRGSQATGFYCSPLIRSRSHEQAIIVEGESDAWAAAELWPFDVVLALPTGAAKFDQTWPGLEGWREVYVCLDADDAGEKAADRIVAQIGATKLNVPEPFGDINEAWRNGALPPDFKE
jgi:Toprim domain/CHC2 zinc finger